MENFPENLSLNNPIVTILDDEDDGNLAPNDISLREAIVHSQDGSKVSFDNSLKNKTILLTRGELSIDKNLTIQGFDNGQVTINGNNKSRVFDINNNLDKFADVTIDNLTITGGNAGNQNGGGILNTEKLTINNSIITDNSTNGVGGGISSDLGYTDDKNSATVINNSVISNNSAGEGAGIYHDAGITVNDYPFSLFLNATSVTSKSTDGSGGGIDNNYGRIKIDDSTIDQNTAVGRGGGIISSSKVEAVDSTISNNRADSGGGINIAGFDGGGILIDSTISGNTAKTFGGGILFGSTYGSQSVTNSTITNNSAPEGGGIQQGNEGRINITSSIIAGNVDNNDANGAGIISGGNNLIGNGNGAPDFVNLFNDDLVGTANKPIDPQLGELKDNGGATFTHALLPESIAINTGSNPEKLTTDQRGKGFERVLFDATDIGAFEADTDSIYDLPFLPPEPTSRIVTTLNDEDDGDLSADDISLREAILESNSGDSITFDPSLSGGKITLTLGELTVDKSLSILGLGADKLTIDADNKSRVFNVDNGSDTRLDVAIAKLTITGGNAAEEGGGGINNQENLTVNQSIIRGNSAKSGGGVSTNKFATTTVNNSTISENLAEFGGGVYNSDSNTTINNSTISNNNSTEYGGGGIFDSTYEGGSTIVNNSTISGNTAQGQGGGIDANAFFRLEVNNSTITDNTAKNSLNVAGGNGSGVYSFSGVSTFTSSIIAGNAKNDDFAGDGKSGGNNFIGKVNSTVFVNGIKQDIVGTNKAPIDPQLGELQDNGGLTFTHALLPDSPAINTGSNTNKLTTDQRGKGFERTLFDATDIGAFEADTDSIYAPLVLPPDPTVTILDDEDDRNLSADDISLREAILYSDSGDTITFDPNLKGGTITLELGQLIIDKDLTIKGLGANNLTIDANNNSRVLKIDDAIEDSNYDEVDDSIMNVTLDGLTITGGSAKDSTPDFHDRLGGGIYNRENLVITNSIIAKNVSKGGGGGIYNQGTIKINSSTIADNSAESYYQNNADGGGILNSDEADDGSITMKISNSTISANTAQGNGGGISNSGSYHDNSSQTIISNSTISGNTTQGNGGGVDSFARHTKIQNSTIFNNSGSLGSGVYHKEADEPNLNGSTTLESTIVAGNVGDRDIDDKSIVISDGHNLIGNGDKTDFADGVNGDLVGTLANPLEPKLGELRDNGGLTFTHALLPDSPAINVGSNPNKLTTDQRRLKRSIQQTDIGAYEVQSEPINSPINTIINGEAGNDTLKGSAGDDIISGDEGRDILNGEAGNDTLKGGQQFDRLNGGKGNDVLIGGGDIDVLTGDAGQDLFYLENIKGGLEWIRDFELNQDRLGLADDITYDELEITGRVNSFISYQGELAVVLGVSPSQLTIDQFQEI
ncbi:choice-of-anchor Q domain-containing protein [Pleurocapsa sp. FMAR1]|uniref:choice-of-anchor Q domain-containing protein n=1 Tax=Pleurocapsa sp. FMAR1 TaxID=3040204 RepID=UPI0029C6B3CC|nr:choice-of-anchor Q domain-containing protein [Pleurocapsa sp. FMAR1]